MEKGFEQFWADSAFAKDQWSRTGKAFRLWRGSDVQVASINFRSSVIDGHVRPLLLGPGAPDLEIPIDGECVNVHILGQVTFPGGYPMLGNMGDVAAVYTLQYKNGKRQELPVRNGFEVVQSNCITGATRIHPTAVNAPAVLRFNKDIVREQYQILLWSIPVSSDLKSLQCKSLTKEWIAIFAITRELAH
jgi:hypothetical protein